MTLAKKNLESKQILTANDLLTGAVVYRDQSGGWSGDINAAQVFPSIESAAHSLAVLANDETHVVGVESIGVHLKDEAGPEPVSFREQLRLRGPSVTYNTNLAS